MYTVYVLSNFSSTAVPSKAKILQYLLSRSFTTKQSKMAEALEPEEVSEAKKSS